jgi:hypothetical protein
MSRKFPAKTQDEQILEEVKKWDLLLHNISPNKKKAAAGLVDRVAFMTVTLQILEYEIKSKGPTYQFKNGSQKMHVENPAQKSYNTMINRYTAACEKLLALIPEADNKPKLRSKDDLV